MDVLLNLRQIANETDSKLSTGEVVQQGCCYRVLTWSREATARDSAPIEAYQGAQRRRGTTPYC